MNSQMRTKVIFLALALAGVLYLKNCVQWERVIPDSEEPAGDNEIPQESSSLEPVEPPSDAPTPAPY